MWKDIKPVMIGIILMCAAHAAFAIISGYSLTTTHFRDSSACLSVGLFSIQNHWDPLHDICSVAEATGQVELLAFYAVSECPSLLSCLCEFGF